MHPHPAGTKPLPGANDMRAVVQRVSQATVQANGIQTASMGRGLLVLLAAGKGDSAADVAWLAEKIVHLRVFPDDSDRMNRSLHDVHGEMIVVSQFTLFGDCRKGRRPSFVQAMDPEPAARLVDLFVNHVKSIGISCGTGVFGARMLVALVNDGPVTLVIDSAAMGS
jgi:D-tyrosyl-tRNA(Tyr) deacylase